MLFHLISSVNSDLRGHLPVWPTIAVLQLHIGLLVDSVQVFVEAVQEEGQQLLRVLLLEAIETGGVLCYRPLERKQ